MASHLGDQVRILSLGVACLIADYGKELSVLEVGLRCHCDGGQWAVLGLM